MSWPSTDLIEALNSHYMATGQDWAARACGRFLSDARKQIGDDTQFRDWCQALAFDECFVAAYMRMVTDDAKAESSVRLAVLGAMTRAALERAAEVEAAR